MNVAIQPPAAQQCGGIGRRRQDQGARAMGRVGHVIQRMRKRIR
jgi:hypothetical protein